MSMTGTLEDFTDCGSVIGVVIDGATWYAEPRPLAMAVEDSGMARGDVVDYDVTDWGGLAWIAPADGEF